METSTANGNGSIDAGQLMANSARAAGININVVPKPNDGGVCRPLLHSDVMALHERLHVPAVAGNDRDPMAAGTPHADGLPKPGR